MAARLRSYSATPPTSMPVPAIRQTRILLIEDDRDTALEIVGDLTDRGYCVTHTDDGNQGLQISLSQSFDLIIVDRMLPGIDGLSILSTLRTVRSTTPVLVLSALSNVDDRVRGLKAGGDDYLGKPFAFAELAARVEALLRRPAMSRETVVRAGPLEIDLIDRIARRDDRIIKLLPQEFKLLEYLMRRPGQIMTRTMLLEDVWGYRFLMETNLVDVHMSKLRRKVDGANEFSMIRTLKGVGYMLCLPTDQN